MTNTIIISAPVGSTGYTINAPTTTIGAYLSDPANARLAVSIPTTATTRLFSSMGRTGSTTVWRLRNGVGQADVANATLNSYGGGFSQQYSLLSGTDTFVSSTVATGSATHILSFPGFSSTKAAGNQAVSSIYTLQITDIIELRGAGGNDILNGGSRADRLLGNAGNDTLTGNAGNDTLDGGTGNDSLIGGLGDDLYIVDSVGDVTTETSTLVTEIDTVQSSVTRTLGDNLENLTLTGVEAINGTGNSLNNVLIGNSANNTLTGDGGADTLTGGLGADTFVFKPDLNDPLFTDTVTDFTPGDGDVFAFGPVPLDQGFIDVPAPGTSAILGNAANALLNLIDDSAYIVVDTEDNINALGGFLFFIRFAYATDTNRLLYSSDGFGSDSSIIADTNDFGSGPLSSLTSANFAFVA